MAIVRVNKTTGNYYMAHKGYVEDERLSFKAKGIMSYLFSKPDNWVIYQTEVANSSKDGKSGVRTAFNELLELGYLTREMSRKENGDFDGYDYTLHEQPVETVGEVRKMENAKMENAKMVYAKSHTTNNNLTNNNLTNNNKQRDKKLKSFDLYQKHFGILNSITADKLNNWIDDFDKDNQGDEIVSKAMEVSVSNKAESFKYVETILKNWSKDKITKVEQIKNEKPKKTKQQKQQEKSNFWEEQFKEVGDN